MLRLSDFQYELPKDRIAQHPAAQRELSKLLVLREDQLYSTKFLHINDNLPKKTLFVVNNTKVIPSRFFGNLATGGKIELLALETQQSQTGALQAICVAKPLRKLQIGKKIFCTDNLELNVCEHLPPLSENDLPRVVVSLPHNNENEFNEYLQKHGKLPLPPYINRENTEQDKESYQTRFAKVPGSVAAPTAGLHFSDSLKASLCEQGHAFCEVTLHVGLGTFSPVKNEVISAHKMHHEQFEIPQQSADLINRSHLDPDWQIVFVGSTSLRACESFFGNNQKQSSSTDLFIYPKTRSDIYRPARGDGIITNFHLPGSTLFMLVCALVGFDRAHEAYRYAIDNDYRFFSYGDTSLLYFPKG